MHQKPLIGFSFCAVVLFVLGSLSNVVGYQTIQPSPQNLITEKINQRDLLFQTIVDLANNKEIYQIMLESSMMNKQVLDVDAQLVRPITKQQLHKLYGFGLLLSRRISKSRIVSMIQTHRLITPELQQKIDAVIENNPILKDKITQLGNSDCGCEKSIEWGFPVICTVLLVIMGIVFIPWVLLMLIFMIPPSALDEMLDLLILMLSPVLILWERFNCSLPEVNHPFPSNLSPADGEQNVSLDLTELSFQITDKDRGILGLMSYKVTTNPPIGEGGEEWVRTGTYTIPIHGLQENTKYRWELLLYEGGYDATPRSYKYKFYTEAFTPFILNPSPADIAEFVPINTSNVSIDLVDPQHELMNWTVETQPDIGSGAGTGVTNGRYTVPISGLDYFTKYIWFVNVTDGTYWAKKKFSFKTTTENTMVLEPTDDATISEPDENVKLGTRENILLRSCRTWNLEGLIRFNLSAVPSNVTIKAAGLQMFYYYSEDGSPSGNPVNLYRITSDWDEENVTWNTKPSSVGEPSSVAVIPASINNWVYWNVTEDTQMFHNNSTINYGWRIKDVSGEWDNAKLYFRSKDYIEYHPYLIIGYE